MIWGKHNFTSNYINAIGYRDEFMAEEIIIDEIARLIVEDKKDVVEALRKAGINATYKDNNGFIKALLVKEIENENPDIIRFISEKIVHNQVDSAKLDELVKSYKATGEKKSTFIDNLSTVLKNENVKDALGTLIAGGVKKAFSKSSSNKTSNDQQLSERLKINEMQAAAKKSNNKKIIIITLGTIGLLGFGVLVFYLTRKKYSNGGMVENVTVTPGSPTPINPAV